MVRHPEDDAHIERWLHEVMCVEAPFWIYLHHGDQDLLDMFQLAAAFDFFEITDDDGRPNHKTDRPIVVDVVELRSKTTVLKVTPEREMHYQEIAQRIQHMLTVIGRSIYNSKIKVERVVFEHGAMGIPVREKRFIDRIL